MLINICICMLSRLLLYAQNALLWHEYMCSVPLIHCISDTLSQAMPDLHGVLLQFTDVMNLTSVANVSMPKEDILAVLAVNVGRQCRLVYRGLHRLVNVSWHRQSNCLHAQCLHRQHCLNCAMCRQFSSVHYTLKTKCSQRLSACLNKSVHTVKFIWLIL